MIGRLRALYTCRSCSVACCIGRIRTVSETASHRDGEEVPRNCLVSSLCRIRCNFYCLPYNVVCTLHLTRSRHAFVVQCKKQNNLIVRSVPKKEEKIYDSSL